MLENGVPDPKEPRDDASVHDDAVKTTLDILSRLHPPGSFDVNVTSTGNVTLVVARNNPIFFRERARVAEECETIDTLLRVGEARPEAGTTIEVMIGGRPAHFVFDSMVHLADLVRLGISTAEKHYVLIDEERARIETFKERIDLLLKS